MPNQPLPFISSEISHEFKESGKVKKTIQSVTVKGKLVVCNPPGAEPDDITRLEILMSEYVKMENMIVHSIDELFAIGSLNQSQNFISGSFKLRSKSFQADAGNYAANYSVTIEKIIQDDPEVDDSWSLEPSDEYDRFVKVTRTRSVTYIPKDNNPDEDPLDEAMKLVPSSSSVSEGSILPSPISISDSTAFNKTTVYSVNTEKNYVQCTESWTICNENALVEETYSIKETADTIFKSANKQINIRGLEGASGSKYANALSKLNELLPNVEAGDKYSIAGISANVRNLSVSKNEIAGTVSISIDTSEGIEKDGELLRTVDINDSPPIDHFAMIQAVGKPEGPILQQFGTTKQGTKTVNLTVLYKNGAYKVPEVEEYGPNGGFVDKDEISYDERSGRITRNVTWIYGGDFS